MENTDNLKKFLRKEKLSDEEFDIFLNDLAKDYKNYIDNVQNNKSKQEKNGKIILKEELDNSKEFPIVISDISKSSTIYYYLYNKIEDFIEEHSIDLDFEFPFIKTKGFFIDIFFKLNGLYFLTETISGQGSETIITVSDKKEPLCLNFKNYLDLDNNEIKSLG